MPPIVYAVSGGVSKFAKARPDKTFQAVVKEAYDYAIRDLGLTFEQFTELVDGSVASYFSDHFQRQLMSGIMVQDYLGLCPKPGHRVEGGGATPCILITGYCLGFYSECDIIYNMGFPGGTNGKESVCQCMGCEGHGFDLWVGKIP